MGRVIHGERFVWQSALCLLDSINENPEGMKRIHSDLGVDVHQAARTQNTVPCGPRNLCILETHDQIKMEVNKREVFVLVGLFGAPCALILAECVRDSSLFAVHPAMNALANLICTPAALYLMLERKRVKKHQTRVLLTKLHLALHILAAVLMAVGGVAIFQVKKSFGKRHLTSIHSWAGTSMSLFFLLNILQGLLLTFEKKPSNWQWKDETHGLVGTIVYITSVVTMGYGLYSGSWGVDHFGVQRQQHLLILIGLAHVVMLGKAIVASRPASSKTKSS